MPTGAIPTLSTSRLILRPLTVQDAPRVQELAGAWEVADGTLTIPHPYPDGAAEAWIGAQADAWQAGALATYGVVDRDTNELVASVGLVIDQRSSRAELGYWVGVPFWNLGIATEAGHAIIAFAFETLGLHRVEARHFLRNPSSGRVMQKLGMRFEGVHRGAERRWDRFEDLAVYAILEDEWRAAREALARKPTLP